VSGPSIEEPGRPGPLGAPPARPVAELTYAEASRELDEIVAFFEGAEVDVDQLVAKLERATALVEELERRVKTASSQVEELVPRLLAHSGRAEPGEPDDDEPF